MVNGMKPYKYNTGTTFPRKLHIMLEFVAENDLEDIVSWQPGDNAFKVHKPQEFTEEILQVFFKQTKYKSFQRQLNIYGFQRIQHGPDKGGYCHKHFVRDSPDLCELITRKGGSDSSTTVFKDFIDSYPIEPIPVTSQGGHTESEACLLNESAPVWSGNFEISNIEINPDAFFFHDSDCMSPFDSAGAPDFIRSSMMDDFSPANQNGNPSHDLLQWDNESLSDQSVINGMEEVCKLLSDSEENTDKEDYEEEREETNPHDQWNEDDDTLTFPWKLHLMLEHASRDGYDHIVSWVKNGTAFRVHDTHKFVEQVMPMYFDQTQYESFRRQLNLYGFSRVKRGRDRGMIFHRDFLRDARYLCENIRRRR